MIAPPAISENSELNEGIPEEIESDGIYENLKFVDCDLSYYEAKHTRFDRSLFSKTKFQGACFEKMILRDCVARNSDFANLISSSSKLKQCLFDQCRFTGVNMSLTRFESVRFESLKADMANFYECEFINCKFKDSDLTSADFRSSKLVGAVFENCNLTKTLFADSNLKDARFIESSLQNAHIGQKELKGVRMTQPQVLDNSLLFAKLLDINID